MDISQDKRREEKILSGTQFLLRLKKYTKQKVKASSIDQIHHAHQHMELKVISFGQFITQVTFLIHKCFKFKVDLILKGKLYITQQKTVFGIYFLPSQNDKPLCRKMYFQGAKNKQQIFHSSNNRVGICQFQGIYYNFKDNQQDKLLQVAIKIAYKYFYHKFARFLPTQKDHYIYEPLNKFPKENIIITSKQFMVMLQDLQPFKKHSFLLKVQRSLFLFGITLNKDNFKFFKQKLIFQSNFLALTKQKYQIEKNNPLSLQQKSNNMSKSNKEFQFEQQKLKLLILKGKQINQTFQKVSLNRQTLKFAPSQILQGDIQNIITNVMFQLYGNNPKQAKHLENLQIEFQKSEGTTFQSSNIPIFILEYEYNNVQTTIDQNTSISNLSFQSSGKNPIIKGSWLIVNKMDFKKGRQQQNIVYLIELFLQTPFKIESINQQKLFINWCDSVPYGTFYQYDKQKKMVYLKGKINFESINKIYEDLVKEIDILMCSYLNFQQMLYRAEKMSNLFMDDNQRITLENLEQEEKKILKARCQHYFSLYQLLFNNYKKQLIIL